MSSGDLWTPRDGAEPDDDGSYAWTDMRRRRPSAARLLEYGKRDGCVPIRCPRGDLVAVVEGPPDADRRSVWRVWTAPYATMYRLDLHLGQDRASQPWRAACRCCGAWVLDPVVCADAGRRQKAVTLSARRADGEDLRP